MQKPASGGFRHAKRLHPFGVAECFAHQNPPTQALGWCKGYKETDNSSFSTFKIFSRSPLPVVASLKNGIPQISRM